MRILFIDPPGLQKPLKNKPGIGLNLAVATLTPILVKQGHQVSLFDMANHYECRSIEFIRESLSAYKPDIIGITILNAQYEGAVNIIKHLRKITCLPIVVGGAEITAIESKIFQDTDYAVDISVLGEGEESLVKIMECMGRKDMPSVGKIPGLIVNSNGNLKKTGSSQMVTDLDGYPPPDLSVFGIRNILLYKLMGSRGCPFNCSFCFSYLGKKWRYRNPKKIVEELLKARERYDYKEFRFLDPVFNFNPEWVRDLCDEIIAAGLSEMRWEALGVRADKLDDDLCGKMSDAGCKRVAIGVESLHPEVFKLIKKGETIDALKRGVKTAAKYFERTSVFLIIGLPGDNRKRSLFTYHEVKKLNPTDISLAIAVPYSGTRLDEWVTENAQILGSSYDSFTRGADAFEGGVAFETDDFNKRERLDTFKTMNTKEFKYSSRSKYHHYLDPIEWFKDAAVYDYFNLHKHAFQISWQILTRLQNKYKASVLHDESSYELKYDRIPDGTWWLG